MKKKIFKTMLCLILLNFFSSNSTSASTFQEHKNIIIIDLYSFTLSLIDTTTTETIKTYPIAIGKKTTPSPIGTWQIQSKALMKGPFGGYWLGLNAPWDTFGIHGTSNPSSIGSMASSGCIRLFNEDIKDLFNRVDYGTSVIIEGGPNWLFSPYTRDIHLNDKGSDVYHIERILNGLGYYNDTEDGIYDYTLQLAVEKYKKDHNLPINPIIDKEFLESIGCTKFE